MAAFTILAAKPVHEHDCDECQFLGTTMGEGVTHDHYYCPRGGDLIARYGVDGDYASCDSDRAKTISSKHMLYRTKALAMLEGLV